METSLAAILFKIAVLVLSVVIHETAHGYAALRQGDPTAKYQGRLSLNPLPHLDPLGSIIIPGILALSASPVVFGWAKPVPVNPYNFRDQKWGELKVALAGPLSNLAVAVILGTVLRLAGYSALGLAAVQALGIIIFINLVLAVFNLLPVPPLDGSKVLFALLPRGYAYIRYYLEHYGLLFLIPAIFIFAYLMSPVVNLLYYLVTGGTGGLGGF